MCYNYIIKGKEVDKMTLQECYEVVFNDIIEKGDSLFTGCYDANNGSIECMRGIAVVMEYLAYSVSDDIGAEFSDLFIENIIKSKEKVLTK